MPGEYILFCFVGGILVMISYEGAALFHEGGHALFGQLFGGICLWIRLGRVLWVPGGGIFVRKGKGGSIRAGECVLLCPDKRSLLWAAFGGGYANLLSGLVAGALWINWRNGEEEILALGWTGILLFAICSLLMAFLSLCFWRKGEENDGLIAKKIYLSEEFCRHLQKNQQKDFVRLEFGLLDEMF